MAELAGNRFYWINILTELRSIMMKAEAESKAKLTTPDNGGTNTDAGVWIETLSPVFPSGSPFGGSGGGAMMAPSPMPGMMGGSARERGGYMGRMPGGRMPVPAAPMASAAPAAGNAISSLSLLCRGINRQALSPSANSDLAYFVLQNLTNSPYFTTNCAFGPEGTQVDAGLVTFTFPLVVELRHPFKL